MPPVILFALPVASTLLGGLLAMRLRRYLSLLTALGAGLLLGAALLDLLPEAIVLGPCAGLHTQDVFWLLLGAFLIFHGIEFGFDFARRRWRSAGVNRHLIGRAGAAMLIFHSLRDGMAIGAAYVVSHPAGYAVAMGIAAHDLGDGINAILLATGGEPATRVDWGFLAADAAAPVVGILMTGWWKVSALGSVLLLVLAAGFFLQMACSGFWPRMRRYQGPRACLLSFVLLGAAVIYGANLLVNRPS